MSTSDGAGDRRAPATHASVHAGQPDTGVQLSLGGGESGADHGSGNPGGGRRKRRRPRQQHAKRPRPQESQRSATGGRVVDLASRERVFQSVEGLLRQIREQAEEGVQWTEEELREITQTVTTFTKGLEQESDPISDRAHAEYQRVREKLSQALNRGGQAARESAGGL